MSVEDSLDGSSEDELKPELLENDEDWSRLSTVSSDSSYPTYTIGGIDQGLGLLQVKETPELENELIVVYEFISEGEDEIVTNLQESKPNIHTVDLPYNQFDDPRKAEGYAEFVMAYGVEKVLSKYGIKVPDSRGM